MSKIIFHVDMNAFFASVEEIKYPFLINKPFAIASRTNEKSIISTCNYEARKYGVKSAMNFNVAKKLCKDLIAVDPDYEAYNKYSKKIMEIFLSYTDLVLQASIDEAYLDVTGVMNDYVELAKTIQRRILNELKLPCSIGIGPTLFLAKMASDMKKPLGITIIRKKDIKNKLYNLDISEFFGIGKKTTQELEKYNIKKIGDLESNKDILLSIFKQKQFNYIFDCLSGKSSDVVDPRKNNELSSLSNSRTYLTAVFTYEEAILKLDEIAHLLYPRFSRYNLRPKTVTVQIRYEGFITKSRSKTFNEPIIDFLDLSKNSKIIFDDLWDGNPIRLLGINVTNFDEEEYNLFTLNKKEYKIDEVIRTINKKEGKKIINKVKTLID